MTPPRAITGLYVHLPFCDGKCPYCAFYSERYTPALADAYLDALAAELAAAGREYGPLRPATVYLGGGTPTLLAPAQLDRLAALLHGGADLGGVVEWTAEANPGSLDAARLAALLRMGVNRISLGVQAFDDATLRRLGRRHSAADVQAAIAALGGAGLRNWGLDLIACVPGVDAPAWERTLDAAVAAGPTHVSVYALTVEEGSELARRAGAGAFTALDDDAQLARLQRAEARLGAAGLARYEISNYARPGGECRHNLACWRGENYLGLGSAAASRVGARRWTNRADLAATLAAARAGRAPEREIEDLTPLQQAAERLVFGLRLQAGVRLDEVCGSLDAAGAGQPATWDRQLAALAAAGLTVGAAGVWRLTARGRELADHVAVELMP
jgi:oxygen-independent coproporphyrinogen-3 oxidase